MDQPTIDKDEGFLGFVMIACFGMMIVAGLFLLSDQFMVAQQAMFNAMAIMAEVCRL